MSHNVPAVCDVLAGRISKPQVCSPAKMWVKTGVGAVRRPSQPEPRSDQRERSAYSPVMCSWLAFTSSSASL
jgi:hypothetical protein